MVKRWIALLCLAAWSVPATADQPYQATVCLRFTDDPMLTPLLVAAVERQVRDQLTNYLGPLAQLEVLTHGHWLLDEFPSQPIDEPPLTPQVLADRQVQGKIFLVTIDHVDELYHVACRHVDSRVQYVGEPRSRTTPDRQWLGKAVCLAIKEDFLPVAVITPAQQGKTVKLAFQGAQWRPQLIALLGEDCILQPYWVFKQRGGASFRVPIPFTVLRLRTRDGITQATVISNLSNPWRRTARVAGFEAIKLNTQPGRIRLQLVDAATELPVMKCVVSANDQGFDEFQDGDILDSPNRDGVVVSREEYGHLAFVRVSQGGGAALQLPVPITGAVCEQVVKLTVDKAAGAKSDFERNLRFLVQDVQTLAAVQADGVREANDLNSAKRYEDAIRRVEAAVNSVRPLRTAAQSNYLELTNQAPQLGQADKPLLKWVGEQLKEIRDREADLGRMVQALNDAIDLRTAQGNANRLIEQAIQAERDANIEEAITRYELALSEQPQQPELRKKLEQLKEAWRIKNPAHGQARRFVYEIWAKAEVTEVEQLLLEAAGVLQTLKSVQDHLTMQRLLAVNGEHLSALVATVEQAEARGGEADLAESQKYARLLDRVADFNDEAAEAMQAALAGAPTVANDTAPPDPVPNPAAPSEASPAPANDTNSPDPAPPAVAPPANPGQVKPPPAGLTLPDEAEEEPPLNEE